MCVNKEKEILAILGPGKFMGEKSLLEKITRSANVRAKTYCDLYILKKDDFYEVMNNYPVLLKEMENEIRRRNPDK